MNLFLMEDVIDVIQLIFFVLVKVCESVLVVVNMRFVNYVVDIVEVFFSDYFEVSRIVGSNVQIVIQEDGCGFFVFLSSCIGVFFCKVNDEFCGFFVSDLVDVIEVGVYIDERQIRVMVFELVDSYNMREGCVLFNGFDFFGSFRQLVSCVVFQFLSVGMIEDWIEFFVIMIIIMIYVN